MQLVQRLCGVAWPPPVTAKAVAALETAAVADEARRAWTC